MNRITNIEYVDNGELQAIIKISIDDMFTPILVDTEYADTIVIWWYTDTDTNNTNKPMRVYAIENYDSHNQSINLIGSWDHINILKGLRYAISKAA